MSQVRRVLKHVRVERAERRRKCHRNRNHLIARGEVGLAIYEPPRNNRKNYCTSCAEQILARARDDVSDLLHGLETGTPTESNAGASSVEA